MSENDRQLKNGDCYRGLRIYTPAKLENPPGLSSIKYRVGTHGRFKASMLASLSKVLDKRLDLAKLAERIDKEFPNKVKFLKEANTIVVMDRIWVTVNGVVEGLGSDAEEVRGIYEEFVEKERKISPGLSKLTTRSDDDLAIGLIDAWATVSDVLTFYQERIANESFLRTAKERRSVLELARAVGYELGSGVAASTFLAFTLENAPGALEKTIIDAGSGVQSLPAQGEMPQIFETSEKIEARPEWNNLKPKMKIPQVIDPHERAPIYFKGTDNRLKPGDGLLLGEEGEQNTCTPVAFNTITKVEIDETNQQTKVIFFGDWQFFPDKITNEQGARVCIYVFRVRTGPFGHNAPNFNTLTQTIQDDIGKNNNWDDDLAPVSINTTSRGGLYDGGTTIYLDGTYPGISPNSWIVLTSPGLDSAVYLIKTTTERTMADFLLSARVTGLTLEAIVPETPEETLANDLKKFKLRKTSIHVQSEKLEPAEISFEKPVKLSSIVLDCDVNGLKEGQLLAITGELEGDPGVIRSEIAVIDRLTNPSDPTDCTKIYFTQNLTNTYKRDTVTLNANVARASHGEAKTGILGSGDPSQRRQEFVLKQKPLTFVSAPTATGAKSTLKIRINDILWKEYPSLYDLKPGEKGYIIRIENDRRTRVIFGDGIRGARPPAGIDNIRADYRVGIGKSGLLKADQLTMLKSRPLGVRKVTNPIAPTGAEDPEDLSQARENAPLTVLTLDRLVSLEDFENFAISFRGIGKAKAVRTWDCGKEIVQLTVATFDGKPVESTSETYENLVKRINDAKDPLIQVRFKDFTHKTFNVTAEIVVAKDRDPESVKLAVSTALRNKFSFENMQFGQAITQSEVIALIQRIEGVVMVDLNYLYYGEEKGISDLVPEEATDIFSINPETEGVTLEVKLA